MSTGLLAFLVSVGLAVTYQLWHRWVYGEFAGFDWFGEQPEPSPGSRAHGPIAPSSRDWNWPPECPWPRNPTPAQGRVQGASGQDGRLTGNQEPATTDRGSANEGSADV